MRFPFFRNRDSVKNGILISIRRTGDGFHPGLFIENTGTIRYLLKDINKCVWECLVPEKEVNRIEQVYTVSNRKYGEDGVVLRLISREKPFANAKQVDPVLEDLYLFYFREGE